jgi:ankyrin repeat protein
MTYFKDHRGRTVIHQAAKEGAMAAAEIILKMRPDAIFDTDKLVSSCTNRNPERSRVYKCTRSSYPDANISIFTYTHTHTNEQGHTPLHYAAACSRVDVCALLLDLGADATQRDSEGLSPLDYARRKKLDYVVALLTCHGTALADFTRASRWVGAGVHEWFGELSTGMEFTYAVSTMRMGKLLGC